MEITEIVHANGGQVYLDGANLIAQVASSGPPSSADVCHMNLHKTFCILHGGGGRRGPDRRQGASRPFPCSRPCHVVDGVNPAAGREQSHGAVSAAPRARPRSFPSRGLHIAMMGGEGSKKATSMAILNATEIAGAP
ncbi:MAG: hypothetical protein U1E16_04725 [Hyphomicrobiales bacterium]